MIVNSTIYVSSACYLGGQFKLSATGKLDYETLSRYNVTFMISDGKTTTGPYSLTINVLNVNEECYFDRQVYYISVLEGKVCKKNILFVNGFCYVTKHKERTTTMPMQRK